jgi:uncharacterized membrane protein (DUF4010 family)
MLRGGAFLVRAPLGLWAALEMAVAFQVVFLAIPYIQGLWGGAGVRASAVVIGVTDMDALTYSMTRFGTSPSTVASTLLKLIVALAPGSGAFRRVAGSGLLAVGAATGLVWWIAR